MLILKDNQLYHILMNDRLVRTTHSLAEVVEILEDYGATDINKMIEAFILDEHNYCDFGLSGVFIMSRKVEFPDEYLPYSEFIQ